MRSDDTITRYRLALDSILKAAAGFPYISLIASTALQTETIPYVEGCKRPLDSPMRPFCRCNACLEEKNHGKKDKSEVSDADRAPETCTYTDSGP